MTRLTGHIPLPTESDTEALASTLAPLLHAGDTLLLAGEIGAGKTAFARALIRARLGRFEDVPSPTFTLVQNYDAGDCDIWHADLYRLTAPDDVLELGLDAAFDEAICLIEWPDRLGATCPKDALRLAFEAGPSGHNVTISGPETWLARLRRAEGAA